MDLTNNSKKTSLKTINIISVAVPLVVAILLGIRTKPDLGEWTRILPGLNAIINSTTAILLLAGKWFILKNDRENHRKVMSLAFICGAVFLVSYVIYHLTNASTSFGGDGSIKIFYYFILISHILLSLVVLPLVLRAIFFAWNADYAAHVKMVKYAWPIWLYVSVTGVVAYLMIKPYYV